MHVLRPYLRALAFVLFTLPLMPLQFLFLKSAPTAARLFPHWYHKRVCAILGIAIKIRGPVPSQAVLLISNHVSWADITVLSACLPLSFVAKREVADWPFFGALAKLQRSVFVDRDRRHTTGSEKNAITERLLGGDTVVLFPEGTSGKGNSLLPFKSSYFGAVEGVDIAIVPVTLAYTARDGLPLSHRQRPEIAWYGDMALLPHLWHFLKGGKTEVTVTFHQPLHNQDRKKTALAAHAIMQADLVETLHGKGEIR